MFISAIMLECEFIPCLCILLIPIFVTVHGLISISLNFSFTYSIIIHFSVSQFLVLIVLNSFRPYFMMPYFFNPTSFRI